MSRIERMLRPGFIVELGSTIVPSAGGGVTAVSGIGLLRLTSVRDSL